MQEHSAGLDPEVIKQWGNEIMDVRAMMVDEIIKHRENLPSDPDEALAAWVDFNDSILTPLIAKRIHLTIEGSKLFNQTAEAPNGGTPVPMYEGILHNEIHTTKIRPFLRKIMENMIDDYKNNRTFKYGDLPETTQGQLKQWVNSISEQLAGTKLAAISHGELQRNRALLDYTQRYGIDNTLEVLFPYQFWYTRSMGEWGKRMIDRPSWFATYAKVQKLYDRMDDDSLIPDRFKGKMQVASPWLPEWMGNRVFVDPWQKLFPFTEFSQPIMQANRTYEEVEQTAINNIRNMIVQGIVSEQEGEKIIKSKEGDIWEKAIGQARSEAMQTDLAPMNLTSMMLTPAMWWTYPYNIAKGTPENISMLPSTRLGQSIRGISGGKDNIPGMIGNILAWPEEAVRRKFNLNTYGQYG
jgi:hypothetical protein